MGEDGGGTRQTGEGHAAAVPGGREEGAETPEADQAVPVAEEEDGGEESEVGGMVVEVWDQLDCFREHDPCYQEDVGGCPRAGEELISWLTVVVGVVEQVSQSTLDDCCRGRESRHVEGIGTPWLRGPDDTVIEHGGDVATPSGAIPPHALEDEFPVALEGGRRMRFGGILDLDLPSAIDQPAGKAVVVISL